MTPKERAVMQQALECLEDVFGKGKVDVGAITALREALAGQAEQDTMIERGTKAWADVPNATEWVEELRGNTEQAEHAPVAWVTAKESFCGFPKLVFSETQKNGYKPLYAAHVRTKDLTDDELLSELKLLDASTARLPTGFKLFARAVIAADREKNK